MNSPDSLVPGSTPRSPQRGVPDTSLSNAIIGASPIAAKVRLCIKTAEQISRVSSSVKDPDLANIGKSMRDQLDRLKIWAGNIGAAQELTSHTSLQYRVRDAPLIMNQLEGVLVGLMEDLEAVEAIITSKRENRKRVSLDSRGSLLSPAISEPVGSTQLSEVEEIVSSITNAITHLLKLSALVREASPRDRYVKAATAVENSFAQKEHWLKYDKMHVRMKFPKLEADGKNWLVERLGEAATRRRQFLHYCERHRELLGRGVDDKQDRIVFSSATAVGVEESEEMKSQFALSEATTLAVPDLQVLQESKGSDGHARSQASASSLSASIRGDDENYQHHTVINLSEIQQDGLPFECPHCCGIQAFKTQRAWQEHVFADLKAYVCLGEFCTLTMFPDPETWFKHEIEQHLSEWQCWYCPAKPYLHLAQYEQHMITQHKSEFKIEQLSALSKISRRSPQEIRASACPFCDWPVLLHSNATSKHKESGAEIFVSRSRYQKHVSNHLEQLALFILPTNVYDNDEESDEESDDKSSWKPVDEDVSADSVDVRKYLRGTSNFYDGVERMTEVAAQSGSRAFVQDRPVSRDSRQALEEILDKFEKSIAQQDNDKAEIVARIQQLELEMRSIVRRDIGSRDSPPFQKPVSIGSRIATRTTSFADISNSHERARQILDTVGAFYRNPTLDDLIEATRQGLSDLVQSPILEEQLSDALESTIEITAQLLPPIYELIENEFKAAKEDLERLPSSTPIKIPNLYGIFLELLVPSPRTLYMLDLKRPPKKLSLTLIFLGSSGVESQEIARGWMKRHEELRYMKTFSRNVASIGDFCVIEQHQRSLCGLSLAFKFANSREEYKQIARHNDNEATYVVLCFSVANEKSLKKSCEEWLGFDPHFLLGFTPGNGAVRLPGDANSSASERRVSAVNCLPREKGRAAAAQMKARMYIECASENRRALDVLFSTLIGCAAALEIRKMESAKTV